MLVLKRIKAFFIFFLGASFVLGQCILKHTAEALREDHLGNWYAIYRNTIVKGGAQMPRNQEYSTFQYGSISHLDVQNPMALTVFYKSYQAVIQLDNVLALKFGPLYLDKLGYPQTEWVCTSQLKGIWIYNQANSELIRLDETGQSIVKTGNLAQFYNVFLEPVYMVEYGLKLFVLFKDSGVWIFDRFGARIKKIPFPTTDGILINDQTIEGCGSRYRYSYHLSTNTLDSVFINTRSEKFYLGPNHFFEIFKDSVCRTKR